MKPSVVGRLHAQGLDTPRFTRAAEVVRHLGCVQSQLHDMALWAVARRTKGATKADLDRAFDHGEFLRTHVLRPTWHFVDPSDIHWLLALTAPRVRQLMASSNTNMDLTPETLERGSAVIAASLADGKPRTRTELATDLAVAGLPHTGQSLGHLMMHAEMEALIINGPMRAKKHTYVLLDSVVAAPRTQPRDELLALVARRYGRGHGPFRDKDLSWWTSLTLTDCRRAIGLGELRPIDIAGETYWTHDNVIDSPHPPAMLLSNFDEYISYVRDQGDYESYNGTRDQLMRNAGLLVVHGQLAGTWTRTIKAATVEVAVQSSPRVTPTIRRAIEAEAAAFAHFVNREPELAIST